VLPSAISDHARVVVDYVLPADCPDPDDQG
jgi:hypothetical protein